MKKRRAALAVCAVAAFLLWRFGFALVKTGDRPQGGYALPEALREQVAREAAGMDARAVARYGLGKTSDLLVFREGNDIGAGEANCVGYAALCSAICDHALSVNGLPGKARPVVGYVTFCGVDLCTLLQGVVSARWRSFVKDHDFVEMDLGDGGKVYFDASLHDFHIPCTTWEHSGRR